MLKYQIRHHSCGRPAYSSTPSSSSSHDTTLTSRSNSMTSLNSVDSSGSDGDWGILKIHTDNIKSCSGTEYKTIRVSTASTASSVIDTVLNKFKLSSRDTNLFELWMEVITKAEGHSVRTILRLEKGARPLELQRCHPANMSRFILHMKSNGSLVRVFDHNISPESNYKSLLLAEETTSQEAVHIVLNMNRKPADDHHALYLTAPEGEAEIPAEISLVSIARQCKPHHKIIIRPADNL